MELDMQPEEVRLAFRKNVIARRLELGLTQVEVAERSQVSQRAISGFEGGDRVPLFDTLVLLALALQTTPSALLVPGMFAFEKKSRQPA